MMQKLKQNKLLTTVVAVFVVALLLVAALVIAWLRRNTAILSPAPTPEQIVQNNQNFPNLGEDVIAGFATQNLEIPISLRQGVFAQDRAFNLPANFHISLYATGLSGPRFFTFDDQNRMYVAEKDGGRIVMLKDDNQDGIADSVVQVDAGLRGPSSAFYYKGDLYVGEENQVTVYRQINDGKYANKQILIPDLPTGGHVTRTVVVGPDEKIYVSIGSSCNICLEEDQRRAAVVQYDMDGVEQEVFASGLRNSVGIVWHQNLSGKNELWSADNGRDSIGDDIPPEEVNVLEEGKDYGWPYCYGDRKVNPEYPSSMSYCEKQTQKPTYELQAHSAPLGITFSPDKADGNFPQALRTDLFVAFHGSWNRTVPTGYKVVRINTGKSDAQPVDFITGWQSASGDVWGRPVGLGFDNSGVMYISDDKAGAIYKVTYSAL